MDRPSDSTGCLAWVLVIYLGMPLWLALYILGGIGYGVYTSWIWGWRSMKVICDR